MLPFVQTFAFLICFGAMIIEKTFDWIISHEEAKASIAQAAAEQAHREEERIKIAREEIRMMLEKIKEENEASIAQAEAEQTHTEKERIEMGEEIRMITKKIKEEIEAFIAGIQAGNPEREEKLLEILKETIRMQWNRIIEQRKKSRAIALKKKINRMEKIRLARLQHGAFLEEFEEAAHTLPSLFRGWIYRPFSLNAMLIYSPIPLSLNPTTIRKLVRARRSFCPLQ